MVHNHGEHGGGTYAFEIGHGGAHGHTEKQPEIATSALHNAGDTVHHRFSWSTRNGDANSSCTQLRETSLRQMRRLGLVEAAARRSRCTTGFESPGSWPVTDLGAAQPSEHHPPPSNHPCGDNTKATDSEIEPEYVKWRYSEALNLGKKELALVARSGGAASFYSTFLHKTERDVTFHPSARTDSRDLLW